MRSVIRPLGLAFLCVLLATSLLAQSAAGQVSMQPTGDRVVRMTGVFRASDGRAAGPVETVTYSIYAEQEGGTPLWQETQTVAIDTQGRYAIALGATSIEGLPAGLFVAGESRWVGVQWQGEAEGPRSLLTSVPYSLKAADADTLGGRPASDYLLAPVTVTGRTASTSATSATANTVTLGSIGIASAGTVGRIAKFVDAANVGDSIMAESGGMIGVGTTTPLDVVHSRFTNTNGQLTGLAVQNLGTTATSYSGMLFYDQNGAVAQFQGFNNSTHEYRINNVASNGSINFMLGAVSKFRVAPTGDVEMPGNLKLSGSEVQPLGTQADGIRWLSDTGAVQAHLFRWGYDFGDQAVYVSNNGPGDLTGVYLTTGGTSWTSASDERLKSDITPLTGILDKIKKIRVVSFNMASRSIDKATGKAVVNPQVPVRTMKNGAVINHEIGSIAQDWVADFPEVVVEPQTDDDYYGLNYDRIGVVALGGVKELSEQLAAKDAEIKDLQARLAALEEAVKKLSKR